MQKIFKQLKCLCAALAMEKQVSLCRVNCSIRRSVYIIVLTKGIAISRMEHMWHSVKSGLVGSSLDLYCSKFGNISAVIIIQLYKILVLLQCGSMVKDLDE